MKKFLLIGIILLVCITGTMVNLGECSSSTSIHSGKISGVINVYWPKEGFKPGRARIDILNTELFTVSSSYGNYVINNIPDGQHTITVSKHGYLLAQKIINVVGGEKVTDIDFNLMVDEPREKFRLRSVTYLGFNNNYPPFDNLKVRQALNYAIDKQILLDEFNSKFGHKPPVAQGPIAPGMMGFNPNLVRYSYDINKAKELLSQAGYPKGFSIALYYNKEGSVAEFIAKEAKKHLAKIGIKVDIKGKKWNEFSKMVRQGKSPFFVTTWRADTPDSADYLYSLYHSKSSSNSVHYYNSVIDNQIEQAWEIIDDEKFVQLIQQIEKTIVNNAPAIYIYNITYTFKK
jgi:ABC-type transport system substrate-binding protein